MGFLSSYRTQAQLLWALALVAILAFSGIQGEVHDIAWEGDLAAVAVGRHGGVRLLDVADPTRPREVGHFDTLGDALAVSRMGDFLLVADGKAGLSVLDVTDPARPQEVGALSLSSPVLDVASDPAARRAFLAAGDGGLVVVDLSTPEAPTVLGSWSPGQALKRVAFRSGRVFVASQTQMWVVDVNNPAAIYEVGTAGAYGDVYDLAVVGLDLVVVAEDTPGLRVYNTAMPGQFPVQDFPPLEPGEVPHIAGRAAVAYGRGAVVGSADGVIYHVSLLNPMQPSLAGQGRVPGAVTTLAVGRDVLAVGMGPLGMMVLDLRTLSPQPLAWYETHGDYSPLQLFRVMRAGVADPRPLMERKTTRSLLTWLGLFGMLLLGRYGAAFFFAQFVLPVHTWSDRWNAFRHLNLYIRGQHGPALFVENGELIEREQEHEKQGPGVIILDTASAAMLRTKTQFTRAVGPGLVFTDSNEFVAATVPLYPRFQVLGPSKDIDMDAFEEALARGEDPPYPEALQTRGQTRDDVAVVARISVAFRLDFDPPQGTQTLGRSRYGYQPEAVEKAVRGSRLDPTRDPEVEETVLPWDQLPAILAVEVWREYLQKFRFNELFDPQTGIKHQLTPARKPLGEPWGETALEVIRRFVLARLTQETVLGLNEVGFPLTEAPSPEYALLKERGIRVLSVSIGRLQFRSSVERNLLRSWQSSWLTWAEQESRYVDGQRTYAIHRGRERGAEDFAWMVTRDLGQYLIGQRAKPADWHDLLRLDDLRQGVSPQALRYSRAASLTWLVKGTRTLVVREPQVHKALEGVEDELSSMLAYVHQLRRKWS